MIRFLRAINVFMRRLFEAGLIEFRRGCRERVGAFTVWKKSGRQRLVVDSRRANQWFGKPKKVHLAGSAFAKIQVDDGSPLEVGGVDISDAFYNIELPAPLRDLFALSPLVCRDAGVSETVEGPCPDDTMVFPLLQSCANGVDPCFVGVSAMSRAYCGWDGGHWAGRTFCRQCADSQNEPVHPH